MRNIVETITGAIVLVVAVWFISYFYNNVNPAGATGGYTVKAEFSQADGISIGTAVKIAGVKVGVVTKQSLDKNSYHAILDMDIKKDILIPKDSSITVNSEGLIGEKYLQISPGAEDEMLKPNEMIKDTYPSIDLMTLIGKMMASSVNANKSTEDNKSFERQAPNQAIEMNKNPEVVDAPRSKDVKH